MPHKDTQPVWCCNVCDAAYRHYHEAISCELDHEPASWTVDNEGESDANDNQD